MHCGRYQSQVEENLNQSLYCSWKHQSNTVSLFHFLVQEQEYAHMFFDGGMIREEPAMEKQRKKVDDEQSLRQLRRRPRQSKDLIRYGGTIQ